MLVCLMAGSFKNFGSFKSTIQKKIIVIDGVNSVRGMFSGNSLSTQKLHLLYDRDN